MKITVSKQTLQRIADEIRILLKSTDTYKPKEFADAIASVTSIYNYQPVGTLKISHNGLYNVANYDKINVQVRENEKYNSDLLEKTGVPWIEPTPQNYEVNNKNDKKSFYLLPENITSQWDTNFTGQQIAWYPDINNIQNIFINYTLEPLYATADGTPYRVEYEKYGTNSTKYRIKKIPIEKKLIQIVFTKSKLIPYKRGETLDLKDYEVKAIYNFGIAEDITSLCSYNIPQGYIFGIDKTSISKSNDPQFLIATYTKDGTTYNATTLITLDGIVKIDFTETFKASFLVNTSFKLNNYKVSVFYGDGTRQDITQECSFNINNNYVFNGNDPQFLIATWNPYGKESGNYGESLTASTPIKVMRLPSRIKQISVRMKTILSGISRPYDSSTWSGWFEYTVIFSAHDNHQIETYNQNIEDYPNGPLQGSGLFIRVRPGDDYQATITTSANWNFYKNDTNYINSATQSKTAAASSFCWGGGNNISNNGWRSTQPPVYSRQGTTHWPPFSHNHWVSSTEPGYFLIGFIGTYKDNYNWGSATYQQDWNIEEITTQTIEPTIITSWIPVLDALDWATTTIRGYGYYNFDVVYNKPEIMNFIDQYNNFPCYISCGRSYGWNSFNIYILIDAKIGDPWPYYGRIACVECDVYRPYNQANISISSGSAVGSDWYTTYWGPQEQGAYNRKGASSIGTVNMSYN